MNLVKQSEDFVSNLLKDNLSNLYSYHNFNHTFNVVNAVIKLCDKEKVEGADKEMLLVARWFHDTGYLNGVENHEDESVKIVTKFLKEKEQSDEFITEVSKLILATSKLYVPQTQLEKIIKDADYVHITSLEYESSCELLRSELESTMDISFSSLEWAKENLNFLLNKHRFYTDYALKKWRPLKEKTIAMVQKRIKKQELKKAKAMENDEKRRIK